MVDTTAQVDSLIIDKYYKNSFYKLQHDPEDDEKIKFLQLRMIVCALGKIYKLPIDHFKQGYL